MLPTPTSTARTSGLKPIARVQKIKLVKKQDDNCNESIDDAEMMQYQKNRFLKKAYKHLKNLTKNDNTVKIRQQQKPVNVLSIDAIKKSNYFLRRRRNLEKQIKQPKINAKSNKVRVIGCQNKKKRCYETDVDYRLKTKTENSTRGNLRHSKRVKQRNGLIVENEDIEEEPVRELRKAVVALKKQQNQSLPLKTTPIVHDSDVDTGQTPINQQEKNSIRRSKRTRSTRLGVRAVYTIEHVIDYNGRRVKVPTISGYKECVDLRTEYQQRAWHQSPKKVEQESKKTKNVAAEMIQKLIPRKSYMQLRSDINNNCTNETIMVYDYDYFEEVSRQCIRFESELDSNDYAELSKGVQIHVISSCEGILCVNKNQKTALNEHDTDVNYFVKRGYLIVRLNGQQNILLKIGDEIKIPRRNKYFIFNPSHTIDAYTSFIFL